MNLEQIKGLKDLNNWIIYEQLSNMELYLIGCLMIISLIVVLVTKKFKVPVVIGYVFCGILLSSSVIRLLPFLSEDQKDWYSYVLNNFDYVADLALGFIAFTIGSELSIKMLKMLGKNIFFIVVFEAMTAFMLVTGVLSLIGQPFYLAILFGAIASATAPAATVMVLKEYNARGKLTSTILAVVGIDDAIALTIFSFVKPFSLSQVAGGSHLSISHIVMTSLLEIGGSVICGFVFGFIALNILYKADDPTKKVITIIATIVGGSAISVFLHLSPLITNIFIGFTFRNYAKKNLEISKSLGNLTIPLYAMFFLLAGTKINITAITSSAFLVLALAYTMARAIGKIGGASFGGYLAKAESNIKKYVGLGLLSQIGIAVALAYTIQKEFADYPEVSSLVFNILLFTTAITEVVGPLCTKYAVKKAGEIE